MKSLKTDESQGEAIETEINLPVSAFLPEDYICDADQRLIAYKRLATLADEQSIEDLAGEWRDRYGTLPETVKNLVLMAMTRLLSQATQEWFDWMETRRTSLYTSPREWIFGRVMSLLSRRNSTSPRKSERKLKVEIWGRNFPQRILRLKRILQELNENATGLELH